MTSTLNCSQRSVRALATAGDIATDCNGGDTASVANSRTALTVRELNVCLLQYRRCNGGTVCYAILLSLNMLMPMNVKCHFNCISMASCFISELFFFVL